jgi:hypothetical protein
MGDGFEFPHEDWKPLRIAPFHFSVNYKNNDANLSVLSNFYNPVIYHNTLDYYLEKPNLHVFLSHLDDILKKGSHEVIKNLRFGFIPDEGTIFTSWEVDDKENQFFNEFYSFGELIDDDIISTIFNEASKRKPVETEGEIIEYCLSKLSLMMLRNFQTVISQRMVNIYARVERLFSRKFEIIPYEVWEICEIESWEKGIATSPEGEKLYDIHIGINHEIISNAKPFIYNRARPQLEKAKLVLSILYLNHPRLTNATLTDLRITQLVNSKILKDEPTERPISRMTVVQAMNELWGKK